MCVLFEDLRHRRLIASDARFGAAVLLAKLTAERSRDGAVACRQGEASVIDLGQDRWRRPAIMIGLGLAAAMPAAAQPVLGMLSRLDTGKWELRPRDGSGRVESLCVSEGYRLIQLRHPAIRCDRYIVDDQPNDVTVQYTCRGKGYGRTRIRRENSQLVQIETQGIADGQPFSVVAEGRRVGDCPA